MLQFKTPAFSNEIIDNNRHEREQFRNFYIEKERYYF